MLLKNVALPLCDTYPATLLIATLSPVASRASPDLFCLVEPHSNTGSSPTENNYEKPLMLSNRQLTDEQLRLIEPRLTPARRAELLPALNAAIDRFEINDNTRRLAAYLSNLLHESNGLACFVENLNYSAQRLTQVWPRRFPTLTSAQPYAHNPTRLAEHTYAGRMGNGPEGSGDGAKFIGRGGIQRTGRKAYQRVLEALGLPVTTQPELLEQPRYAALSDALFWSDSKLNPLADCLMGVRTAAEQRTLTSICRRINGGTNGLDERVRLYWRTLAILERAPHAVTAAQLLDQKIAADPLIPTPETHTAWQIAVLATDPKAVAQAESSTVAAQQKAASYIDLAEELPPSALKSGAQSLQARAGAPALQALATIGAALKAGEIAVWFGVIVVLLALCFFAYRFRADLRRLGVIALHKTWEALKSES